MISLENGKARQKGQEKQYSDPYFHGTSTAQNGVVFPAVLLPTNIGFQAKIHKKGSSDHNFRKFPHEMMIYTVQKVSTNALNVQTTLKHVTFASS